MKREGRFTRYFTRLIEAISIDFGISLHQQAQKSCEAEIRFDIAVAATYRAGWVPVARVSGGD